MKKSVTAVLLVISGLLALFSVVAVCIVLIVPLFDSEEDNPAIGISENSTITTSGQSFEDWVNGYTHQSSAPATKATGKTTTRTTEAEKTTTRSWFTAYTGRTTTVATTAAEATAKPTTTTTTVPKTTRTATQEERDSIYRSVYSEVMTFYTEYKAGQQERIAEIDAEIAELEAQRQGLYADYKKQIDDLYERFKHEFIPVATLEAQITNAYQNSVAPIVSKISELEAEKQGIKSGLGEIESQLDYIIQEEYLAALEEYQQKTLS